MSGAKLRQNAERCALAELTPAEAFTKKEATNAIALSQEILNLAEERIYRLPVKSEPDDLEAEE